MAAPAVTPPPATQSASTGPGSESAKLTAQALRNLAEHRLLRGRGDRLLSLAQALEGAAPAGPWSQVSLFATVGGPVASGPLTEGRVLLRVLTLVRTALIFAPIFWTWYGLSHATAHYSTYLAAHPEASANSFFRLWLNGFDGATWLSFDRLAIITVVLVSLLIAISMVLDWARRDDDTPEDEAGAVGYELAMALADAARHLAQGDIPTLQNQIDGLLTSLDDVVSKVSSAAASVSTALTSIEAVGKEARALVRSAASSTKRIAESVDNGTTTLSQSIDRGARTIADGAGMLTTTVTDSVNTLKNSVNDVTGAAGQLRSDVAALKVAVHDLGARQEENRENIGRLLRDNHDFLEQLLQALSGRITTRQTADLEARIGELATRIGQLAAVVQRQSPTSQDGAAVPPAHQPAGPPMPLPMVYPAPRQRRPWWRFW